MMQTESQSTLKLMKPDTEAPGESESRTKLRRKMADEDALGYDRVLINGLMIQAQDLADDTEEAQALREASQTKQALAEYIGLHPMSLRRVLNGESRDFLELRTYVRSLSLGRKDLIVQIVDVAPTPQAQFAQAA